MYLTRGAGHGGVRARPLSLPLWLLCVNNVDNYRNNMSSSILAG